ncbi:MAG: phage tail sheath subtilisin-like domain-containing protein [Desulfobulbaceae bacterium]|nr:phage tail sheath subtilisin-like domain-containing protein [Desulfobulbaceae bacterium]
MPEKREKRRNPGDISLDGKVREQLNRACGAIRADRARGKKGIAVLFAGPSGREKLTAAGIMAEILGLEIFRADLAAVVNKYIGETEKNLDLVFRAAENAGAVLLLDEADALFGKRSDAGGDESRERGSGISLFMQRVWRYNGIVIIAAEDVRRFIGLQCGHEPYRIDFPEQARQAQSHAAPGVYVEEAGTDYQIIGVPTGIAAFVGTASRGETDTPTRVTSRQEFAETFGEENGQSFLAAAVSGFFENGGRECWIVRIPDSGTDDEYIGSAAGPGAGAGLQALRDLEDVSIVSIPGIVAGRVQQALLDHCADMNDRFCILDPAKESSVQDVLEQRRRLISDAGYGALYYPWIKVPGDAGAGHHVPPCGHVAGIYAGTDNVQGVHKAPVGVEIRGTAGLERSIGETEQNLLNPEGVNCIREFAGRGILLWGARTLASDQEWKYVNVRRFIMYLEKSIRKGTEWVVFQPNNETLWNKLENGVTGFLFQVWRDGALQGTKPEDAFYVKCGRSTMTDEDIEEGRLICLIGVALIKPAEFIIFRMSWNLARGEK